MYQFRKEDVKDFLHQFSLHRPLYLTLGFNDYVKYARGEKTKERMKRNHTAFLKEVHRLTYAKSNRKIPRYVVIERGGKTKGFHSHMVIETPEHLSMQHYKLICLRSWERTKDGTTIHFDEVYNKKGIDGYSSKQQDSRNENAEVDVENCFIQSSIKPQSANITQQPTQ